MINKNDCAFDVRVTGLVQGVGFRPFIWKLATDLGLSGRVRNVPSGVQIHIEGREENGLSFMEQLPLKAPPLTNISEIQYCKAEKNSLKDFRIVNSGTHGAFSAQLGRDISLCEDCRRELFDKGDRRYGYPFINCTNCGPRYSIIRGLPYDRPLTSMSSFIMCGRCEAEYNNPADRRYHAQPVACPDCGPSVWAESASGKRLDRDWPEAWEDIINSSGIAAVKGIGGFHLTCSALDEVAVRLLRKRKHREAKPFALMCPDRQWVKKFCFLSEGEEVLLMSLERPIVVLRIRKRFPGLSHIAPGLDSLGVMLPYSPLHELLLDRVNKPLVMTSANCSSEPMIHTNEAAREKLKGLADLFLMHDRDIVNRCEDSVCQAGEGDTHVTRPGRSMAPRSFAHSGEEIVLAFGADMKNTFAVSHHGNLVLSPYIGDLAHPETQEILDRSIQQQLECFRIRPELLVCDAHPDYYSTRMAEKFSREKNVPLVKAQHHHAHLAAAHFEHGLKGQAFGFAFDGTGYHSDGTVWGGELLLFDRCSFERRSHLKPVPLPGGEKAVQHPRRMLVSYLAQAALLARAREQGIIAEEEEKILAVLDADINCPLTSSMGRLFDAVASLLGVCQYQSYDGEAAMRLEAISDRTVSEVLPWSAEKGVIDCGELFENLLTLNKKNVSAAELGGRFHNTVADMIYACGERLADVYGDKAWVLAGGVFQNRLLREKIHRHPAFRRHRLYFSSLPNDSGIALGQAVIGLAGMSGE
ncbi:carbamoyltransferase HypF [Fibrobacterota bacterium]